MTLQIDQSGKIEQTTLDSIVALADEKKFVVVLPKKVKRILLEEFRIRRKPKMFVYFTFSALLAIIFVEVKPKNVVFIDKEYFGNEDLIKGKVLEYVAKKTKSRYIPQIEFALVGKSSPAHILAARVGTKEIKPNKVITLEEISEYLWT